MTSSSQYKQVDVVCRIAASGDVLCIQVHLEPDEGFGNKFQHYAK
jgi:hypothetical protein